MIAIHGSATEEGKFFVWAEKPLVDLQLPKKRGRKPNISATLPHPGALIREEWSLTGDHLLIGDEAKLVKKNITLLLPTWKGAPLSSPDCSGTLLTPDIKELTIVPWDVPAYILSTDKVVQLLLNPPLLPPDYCYSTSFLAWRTVVLFTYELIVNGMFSPGISEVERGYYHTVWKPWFPPLEKDRFKELIREMPPISRAHLNQKGEGEKTHVIAFLETTLNESVMNSLKTSRPKVRGRPAKKRAESSETILYHSLMGEQGTFPGSASFIRSANDWLSGNIEEDEQPWRTFFSLREPENVDEQWILTFSVQSRNDPSLFIPASDVWNDKSEVLSFCANGTHLHDQFLADLGKAMKIYPPIKKALREACPLGLQISTEDAFLFLKETAPLLLESDYGVLLPAWWKSGACKPSVSLKIKSSGQNKRTEGKFSLDTLVSFNWKVAIGGEEVPYDEFLALVDLKVPLMKVRGKWVILDPAEINKIVLAVTKKLGDYSVPLGTVIQASLTGEISEGDRVSEVTAEGPYKELFSRFNSSLGEIRALNIPRSFTGILRPYQEIGVSWLLFLQKMGMGACLADDMGLGKTVQIIVYILYLKENAALSNPSLVVCPMSLIGNWTREIAKFGPSLKVSVHHGGIRNSGTTFRKVAQSSDIVITTYQTVLRDEKDLSSLNWSHVILDEAQNIKNHETKQSKSVMKIPADSKIAMTGTPIENRLGELWSIMQFLNPGYLGNAAKFQKTFANPIERYHDSLKANQLQKIIEPFVLRRKKSDPKVISDLPEKMTMKLYCSLSKEQATLYEAAVQDLLSQIAERKGISRKGAVLAAIMRLKQICNHPSLFLSDTSDMEGRSGKVDRLTEMLDEICSSGEKSLVFTQFSSFGKMLEGHLKKRLNLDVLFLHGGTPRGERDQMVELFSHPRGPRIFILSLKAGGTGLNLAAANHVFHIDRWWNPAVEDQATDRAYRIGQKKNVQVHQMIAAGTLEERIDLILEEKRLLAEQIIGTGEDWITNLSEKEIRELFELRTEVIEGND